MHRSADGKRFVNKTLGHSESNAQLCRTEHEPRGLRGAAFADPPEKEAVRAAQAGSDGAPAIGGGREE